MKKAFIPAAVLLLASTLPLAARDKMQIAVLDLQPKGVSKVLAGAVTDIIRSEMVKTGLFTVVERGQMNEILKEQGFQMTGCTDSACAVQVGKLLSARKILMGEMNKMGGNFLLTVRIVDVEKGVSEFAASERAVSEDVLDKASADITRKLSENIVEGNKDFFVPRKTRVGYYARSLVPGWGQMYADRDTKGWLFLGAFIAAAGFTTYGYMNFQSADSAYQDVPRGSPQSEFDAKYDDKVAASRLFTIGLGLTAAVYLAHWVDAVFFTRPAFEDRLAGVLASGPYYFAMNGGPRMVENHCIEQVMEMGVGMRF